MQYCFATLFLLLPAVLAVSIPRPLGDVGKLSDDLTKGDVGKERRDDSLAEIIAYVDNDLNDITVDVLRKERRKEELSF
jgi:hypothetical protein